LLIFAFVCFSFADNYEKCLRLCNQHCVNECEEIKQSQKEKNIKEEWIQHEYEECLKFCDQHCVNKCKENYSYSSDYGKKEAQYQKCLDECEQIYERATSFCGIGCFPLVFNSFYGMGWAMCMNRCKENAERNRYECYQRCVLRYKY
jgi:hypothetical protein